VTSLSNRNYKKKRCVKWVLTKFEFWEGTHARNQMCTTTEIFKYTNCWKLIFSQLITMNTKTTTVEHLEDVSDIAGPNQLQTMLTTCDDPYVAIKQFQIDNALQVDISKLSATEYMYFIL
jgi:hypothetical protein